MFEFEVIITSIHYITFADVLSLVSLLCQLCHRGVWLPYSPDRTLIESLIETLAHVTIQSLLPKLHLQSTVSIVNCVICFETPAINWCPGSFIVTITSCITEIDSQSKVIALVLVVRYRIRCEPLNVFKYKSNFKSLLFVCITLEPFIEYTREISVTLIEPLTLYPNGRDCVT